jgi:hypothetical protein
VANNGKVESSALREGTMLGRDRTERLVAHSRVQPGPAQTKDEFLTFLRKKHPQIRSEIVAVESADHPTDPELLAYARKYFTVFDRRI